MRREGRSGGPRARPRAVAVAVVAVAAVAGAVAAVDAGGAAAQEVVWVPAAPQAAAWLGVSYDVEWLGRGDACEPRIVVQSVVHGAPADRAGVRPGDAIVAFDGQAPGAGRLPLMASRLSVGDSIRLRLVRDGRSRDVVAVAGRRPDRPPVVLSARGKGGLFDSDAPIIRVRGDTLVAQNLETPGVRSGYGYWVADDGGRTEYRRISRFSGDDLDRRVVDLLVCAQRTQAAAPAVVAAARPVDMRELQERADSLRRVMTSRALTRPEAPRVRSGGVARVEFAPATWEGGVARMTPDVHVYTFRVGDHVAAGERGVAGAEMTALEPELAEYFRGVRDGLLVLRVAPGTPADRAGLEPGDVITAGGGRTLRSVSDLRQLLGRPDPTPVELRVVRHGRGRTLTIPRD
ncbi:MAG TPA: PDZ domain-containing protein [Longimicrobiales bacterium]|nr:PDZ domain-containing protein [Longimicrobiales bacterium]